MSCSWIQGYCDHSWWFFRGKKRLFKYASRWLSRIKEPSYEMFALLVFCLFAFLLGFVFDVESMAEGPRRITALLYISMCVSPVCI